MKATASLLVALSLTLLAASAAAQITPASENEEVGATEEMEAYEHDGFYFRFAWGLGAMTGRFDPQSTRDASLTASTEFAFGFAVTENLVLYGMFGDLHVARDGGSFDENIDLDTLGLGATYYWTPSNVFVGAAASVYRSDDLAAPADLDYAGAGLQLSVGKEWWVSESWALGVRGQTAWTRLVEGIALDDRLDVLSGGISMTVTYN